MRPFYTHSCSNDEQRRTKGDQHSSSVAGKWSLTRWQSNGTWGLCCHPALGCWSLLQPGWHFGTRSCQTRQTNLRGFFPCVYSHAHLRFFSQSSASKFNVSLHETSFHQKHRNEGSVESASFFTTSTFSRSSSSIKQACEIWKSHPNLTKQAWQCFGQSWRAESFAFSPPFSYLLSALLKFQRARVKWTNLKAWRFYVRPFLLWVYSTDTF